MRILFTMLFCLSLLGGCSTTTQSAATAELIVDVKRVDLSSLTKTCSPNDVKTYDHFATLIGQCAKAVLTILTPIQGEPKIDKLFCPTGFEPQPDALEGSMDNIFLSDRRIKGVSAIDFMTETVGGLKPCYRTTGTALGIIAH